MSFLDYSAIAQEKFSFLVTDYGFEVTEIRENNDGTFMTYSLPAKKIVLFLGYEYRDRRFFFYLNDGTNRIMFHEFFSRHDPSIYWPDLMPYDDDYITALDKNITLLKKTGDDFLSGKEKL